MQMPATGLPPLSTRLLDVSAPAYPASAVAAGTRTGDVLEAAFHDHASVVFGVARCITFDAGLAEEVTQEVFLSLWRKPDSFDLSKGSLRTFLCTLAHRRAVDLVRKEEGRRCRERRTTEHTTRVTDSCSADPAEVLVELDLRDRARRALASLVPRERQVIELAYFEGHTYREVALILGLPEGTTKARIRSALKNLSIALDSGRNG
jgi:RNA polymerase sigma-70 factor, ECF subfamily